MRAVAILATSDALGELEMLSASEVLGPLKALELSEVLGPSTALSKEMGTYTVLTLEEALEEAIVRLTMLYFGQR